MTDSGLTYQLSLSSGHRDGFKSGHVTSSGPVRVCSGISGENLREMPLAPWWLGWEGVSLKLLGPSWGEGLPEKEGNTEDSGGERQYLRDGQSPPAALEALGPAVPEARTFPGLFSGRSQKIPFLRKPA